METGMIIGSAVAFLIVGFVTLVIQKTKDRKEPLTIMIDSDTVRFLLTDDDYDEINIADIQGDEDKVYQEIKKLIKIRSKELSGFVDRVTFFKNGNPQKEQELLSIIVSARV